MKDIESRRDIEHLIHEFYKKVTVDEKIGYIFTTVIPLDWGKHIPVMIDFWDSMLLGTMKYKGNPMQKHIDLNKKETLKAEHFERWLTLWEETIQVNFSGSKASEAIQRARSIGDLMQHKIKKTEGI